MSVWYVVGLALTMFWDGLIVGILAVALASANRRGGGDRPDRGVSVSAVVVMVTERMLRRLLAAAVSANKEFDYLCFTAEQIPPSDFRDVLGAELDFLRRELDDLVRDALSTSTAQRSAPEVGPSGVSR